MPKQYRQSIDDIDKLYTGCILRHKDLGVGVVGGDWLLEGKTDEDCSVSFITLIKGDQNRTEKKRTNIRLGDLEMSLLPLGCLNLQKSVVVLKSIRPEHRGMVKYKRYRHTSTIGIFDPFSRERQILGLNQPTEVENYFVFKAWNDYKFFTPEESLERVVSGDKMGCAFNDSYFFGLKAGSDLPFLFKDGYRIARVSEKGEVLLKPPVHMFMEQLAEFGLKVRKVKT